MPESTGFILQIGQPQISFLCDRPLTLPSFCAAPATGVHPITRRDLAVLTRASATTGLSLLVSSHSPTLYLLGHRGNNKVNKLPS